jgi:hypothetical protein
MGKDYKITLTLIDGMGKTVLEETRYYSSSLDAREWRERRGSELRRSHPGMLQCVTIGEGSQPFNPPRIVQSRIRIRNKIEI